MLAEQTCSCVQNWALMTVESLRNALPSLTPTNHCLDSPIFPCSGIIFFTEASYLPGSSVEVRMKGLVWHLGKEQPSQ